MDWRVKIDRDRAKLIKGLKDSGVPEYIAIQEGTNIANGIWAGQLQTVSDIEPKVYNTFTAYPTRRPGQSEEDLLAEVRNRVTNGLKDVAKDLEMSEAELAQAIFKEYMLAHGLNRHAQNHSTLINGFRLQMHYCPENERLELVIDMFLSTKGRHTRLSGEFKEALLLVVERRTLKGLEG